MNVLHVIGIFKWWSDFFIYKERILRSFSFILLVVIVDIIVFFFLYDLLTHFIFYSLCIFSLFVFLLCWVLSHYWVVKGIILNTEGFGVIRICLLSYSFNIFLWNYDSYLTQLVLRSLMEDENLCLFVFLVDLSHIILVFENILIDFCISILVF